MTGINLNIQNSYAALYSTSKAQGGNLAGSASDLVTPASNPGERLTLSAEAIALSQQTESTVPPEQTPLGGGPGIRPPAVTPLGGGPGIRPPATP